MLTGKLHRLEELCASLGVHTRPTRVGGVWLVPLLSWYHASFDAEPDIEGARPVEQVRALASAGAPWEAAVSSADSMLGSTARLLHKQDANHASKPGVQRSERCIQPLNCCAQT